MQRSSPNTPTAVIICKPFCGWRDWNMFSSVEFIGHCDANRCSGRTKHQHYPVPRTGIDSKRTKDLGRRPATTDLLEDQQPVTPLTSLLAAFFWTSLLMWGRQGRKQTKGPDQTKERLHSKATRQQNGKADYGRVQMFASHRFDRG